MDTLNKLVGYAVGSFVMRQLLLGIQGLFELHQTNFFTYLTTWTFFMLIAVGAVAWPMAFIILKRRSRWWITGIVSMAVAIAVALPSTLRNAPADDAMLYWYACTAVQWFIVGSTGHLVAIGTEYLGRKWRGRDPSSKASPTYW